MINTPSKGIPYVPENTLDPAAGLNAALNVLDALVQTGVISMLLTEPPGSNSDGDMYIVHRGSPAASGAWTNLEDHLVRYVAEGNFWQAFTPGVQSLLVLNQQDGELYRWDTVNSSPPAWVLAAGLGDAPSDGQVRGRKDGAWELIPSPLEVENSDSPPDVATAVSRIILGTNLTLTDLGGGVVQIDAAGGGGGGGSLPLGPDNYPTSPDLADDEFEYGSGLDTAGARVSGATAWAWRNQGASTFAVGSGLAIFTGVAQTSTNLRIVEQAVSGTNWKYRCKLRAVPVNAATFSQAGLCVVNNTSGKILTLAKGYGTNGVVISTDKWTSVTVNSAALGTRVTLQATGAVGVLGVPIYFEIEKSGTNLLFSYSFDGVFWILYQTEALATFISSVDKIGLFLHNDTNSNQPIGVYDWFRKVA